MKLVCIGAGSVGLLLTAKLAASGTDIALVARSQRQAERLAASGLWLEDASGERNVPVSVLPSFEHIVRCAESVAEAALGGPPDWILLTVKQQHLTEPLLSFVGKLAGDRADVLCFQNGIGHTDKIAAVVGPERVHVAVTTEGAKRLAPERVAHTGNGTTWIGAAYPTEAMREAESRHDGGKLENLREALEKAGFSPLLSNQMKEIVWNKLLINSVINPLTALLRIPNGQLPATDDRRRLMRALLDEGLALARALNVRTSGDVWEQIIGVCAATAANSSSMLQDLSEGRSTEIDWINGAMLAAAAERNVPMPVNETIYRLVKSSEPFVPQAPD